MIEPLEGKAPQTTMKESRRKKQIKFTEKNRNN